LEWVPFDRRKQFFWGGKEEKGTTQRSAEHILYETGGESDGISTILDENFGEKHAFKNALFPTSK
jgi:hypothetical protein